MIAVALVLAGLLGAAIVALTVALDQFVVTSTRPVRVLQGVLVVAFAACLLLAVLIGP